ncbi:hypothetical protein niasHT_039452 [Heterodera trifolii]|uniref:Uncharacterized protein n=1 Tax=Heterodera trifolii TaxID=157864 RepID=A0ABD2IIJ2_9BILA
MHRRSTSKKQKQFKKELDEAAKGADNWARIACHEAAHIAYFWLHADNGDWFDDAVLDSPTECTTTYYEGINCTIKQLK